ncbi:MAG: PqiC family protein [Magnetococcus sp. YQC-5]
MHYFGSFIVLFDRIVSFFPIKNLKKKGGGVWGGREPPPQEVSPKEGFDRGRDAVETSPSFHSCHWSGRPRSGGWRHGFLAVSWILMALFLTACPGQPSPPTRFFLLTSLVQPPQTRVQQAGQGLVVELEPVEIPQYLNRPEMVTRTGGNRLGLNRMAQWAGDLKEDIGRVLMENLARLLPSERVMILPKRSNEVANFRVAASMNRFEPDATGQVILDARWTLFDGKGKQLFTRHSHIITQASNPEEYESLAEAMSKALDIWSREMSDTIKSTPSR